MPIPQKNRNLVEQAGEPVADGQDAHPQKNRTLVEQASCLLRASCLLLTGRMPIPQKNRTLVEQAGEPVAETVPLDATSPPTLDKSSEAVE
ncbi:hypothetical protein CP500_011675 [Tychonema bourrellyi FEM_GT703]|uniref:Uncharacterized protein n=1 Tax=Tychonema bourrellyi FEM_GT703 TaxID=2040638 RepID=A0A2G4F0L3_9CYAN|nr:hypothetical protein [Tychonema bourrellyi]PHX55296.1 hypothetical protein CP500_011675 [Tychonema bourrellyi FEM_GT703]